MRLLLARKTGLTSFFLQISFGHNLLILQPIVTEFRRGLLGGKNFLMKIWLPWKICYLSNKSLYSYLTHFELDSNETWQVGSTNENLS